MTMARTSSKDNARTRAARGEIAYQGMNFVRQDLRLAIYLRDGLACVWCGQGIEDGIKFTLDHVVPHVDFREESNAKNCLLPRRTRHQLRAD